MRTKIEADNYETEIIFETRSWTCSDGHAVMNKSWKLWLYQTVMITYDQVGVEIYRWRISVGWMTFVFTELTIYIFTFCSFLQGYTIVRSLHCYKIVYMLIGSGFDFTSNLTKLKVVKYWFFTKLHALSYFPIRLLMSFFNRSSVASSGFCSFTCKKTYPPMNSCTNLGLNPKHVKFTYL